MVTEIGIIFFGLTVHFRNGLRLTTFNVRYSKNPPIYQKRNKEKQIMQK